MDFVNWDDDMTPRYGKLKHVPNHQPDSKWHEKPIGKCIPLWICRYAIALDSPNRLQFVLEKEKYLLIL